MLKSNNSRMPGVAKSDMSAQRAKSEARISKLLLTIALLSSLSVYCADTASSAGSAAAPFNAAGESFQDLDDLIAKTHAAFKAIPDSSVANIAELSALKDQLKKFATLFLAAKSAAEGKNNVLELLDIISSDTEFGKLPVIVFLKTKLNPESSLNLINFLANPNANLGLIQNKDQDVLAIFGIAPVAPIPTTTSAPALSKADAEVILNNIFPNIQNMPIYIGKTFGDLNLKVANIMENADKPVDLLGNALLAYAVQRSDNPVPFVQALIAIGANPKRVNSQGATPIEHIPLNSPYRQELINLLS